MKLFKMMKPFRTLAFTLLLGSGVFPSSGAAFSCADLALVLAIDGSGSINDRDFSLQQHGYAAAFGDTRVQAALASAGTVDVAVVVWGDAEMPAQVLDWQRLTGPGDRARLAADIAGMSRRVTGDTGIGSGLSLALDLLDRDQACAARRIVNVSGDGRESFGPRPRHHIPLTMARARAGSMGVTINALAVTSAAPGLESYYRERVILGPDAFVMAVAGYEDFAEAIARKLAREIALPMVADLTDDRRLMP
jgi:Protein of unknown function (DUF1194)